MDILGNNAPTRANAHSLLEEVFVDISCYYLLLLLIISQHQQQISRSAAEHQTATLRTLPTAQRCVTKGPVGPIELIDSDHQLSGCSQLVNSKPFPPSSENWDGHPFGDPEMQMQHEASSLQTLAGFWRMPT